MAYPPYSLESAFRQEIEKITETDDITFYKRHYIFVNSHRCKSEPKPQQCIDDGRELLSQFEHSSKLAKQKAFYCFSKCKEGPCYEQCKTDLKSLLSSFTEKMDPVMNDYLLKFVPKDS